MVIPLRVPVELGREWKVEAAKAGKSVQKWLLGRMNFTEPVRGKQCGALDRVATEKGGSTPPPTTKPVVAKPVTISGGYGTCSKCGKTDVKVALNKELKPVCYECAGVK